MSGFVFGQINAQSESEDYEYPVDYPEEGLALNIRLQRTRTVDIYAGDKLRQISHRKRLINSQISRAGKFYYEFHNYGCYCVAPSDTKKMRGRPVDEIDRKLVAKFPLVKNTHFVTPVHFLTTDAIRKQWGFSILIYRYKITKTSSGNRIECTNAADTCAYASCMCDKGLAEDLGTLLMNGVKVNSTYREHDGEKCTSDVRIPQNEKSEINEESNRNDGFDNFAIDPAVASSFAQDAAEAVFFADSSSSSSSSDFQPIKFLSTDQHGKTQKIKQCCGQYPKRFPYVVGGNHECCKTGFMEVLKPIGTC
ncbi:unnamed protein product [Oikopleura dioica]|uniref:Phospholipase A2 domain-containing protein n=1 Tax=Oikopleura dioica TaxID=34765 RepID=E4WU98_OIKDI|nr:unnamed protein product [Oikopleura dioica]